MTELKVDPKYALDWGNMVGCIGCWGIETLAGSLSPGMRSIGSEGRREQRRLSSAVMGREL